MPVAVGRVDRVEGEVPRIARDLRQAVKQALWRKVQVVPKHMSLLHVVCQRGVRGSSRSGSNTSFFSHVVSRRQVWGSVLWSESGHRTSLAVVTGMSSCDKFCVQ